MIKISIKEQNALSKSKFNTSLISDQILSNLKKRKNIRGYFYIIFPS